MNWQKLNITSINHQTYLRMSEVNVKISIGCYPQNPQPQHPALYENITVKAFVRKQDIEAVSVQLQKKTGKNALPSFIAEFPIQMNNLKKLFSGDQSPKQLIKDDNYFMFHESSQDQITYRKKIEKVFSELTNLDNELCAKIGIYDLDTMRDRLLDKQIPFICTITERMKIELSLGTDKELIKKFGELATSISPQFANSPIMAALPLLHCLQTSINLQSFRCLQPQNLSKVFGNLIYQEPPEGHQLYEDYHKAIQIKKPIHFYMFLGKLGIIMLRIEARLFALLVYGIIYPSQKGFTQGYK